MPVLWILPSIYGMDVTNFTQNFPENRWGNTSQVILD